MRRVSVTFVLLMAGLSLAGCGDENDNNKADSGTRDGGGTADAKQDGGKDVGNIDGTLPGDAAPDAPIGDGPIGDALPPVDGVIDGAVADARDGAVDAPLGDVPIVDGGAIDGAAVDGGLSEVGAVDTAAMVFVAVLSGAEEVPPVQTSATGSATFVLSTDRTQLTYAVTHTVANATTAAIEAGAAGETGPVAYPLTPVSAAMSGVIMLNPGDADKLDNGMLYVNIRSQANANGELRGQLLHPGDSLFVAKLTGGQETPPTNSAATGRAALILNSSKSMIRYHVTTTGLTGTAAHIHKAVAAVAGPVVYPLLPVGATMDGMITITALDAADLAGGLWFVNVHTQANPNGEIRGQLIMPGEVLYAASLSGANEVPAVTSTGSGGAQFILSASGQTIRYAATITGVSATGANISNATAGNNGPVVFPLGFGTSGLEGTLTVSSIDVNNLNSANYYVNVLTSANPNGELRGQIMAQ